MHHAYLLAGDDAEILLARALGEAAKLLAPTKKEPRSHPDCHIIDTGGAAVPVDSVRQWRQLAYLKPNEADYHVFIMVGAQHMKTAAQNALLALLEEPPSPCVFYLLCDNRDALLPTVRSRCLTLDVGGSLPAQPPEALAWADGFIHALKAGELSLLTHALSVEKLPRAELGVYLDALAASCLKRAANELTLTGGSFLFIISLVQRARQSLGSNPGHGHLLAALAVECREAWEAAGKM